MYPHAPCRRLVHPEVEHAAVPNTGARAVGCTSPCTRRTPHFFSSGPSWPGFTAFAIPFRCGRPRKPWPTWHCAWRCALTAANRVRRGYSRGTRSLTPGVLAAYSRGIVASGIPPWEQYTAKNAPLPSAERAFPLSPAGSSACARLNDRMRGCRGSSCSRRCCLRGTGSRRRRSPPLCRTRSSRRSWSRCRRGCSRWCARRS
jgi:hypothetical protein